MVEESWGRSSHNAKSLTSDPISFTLVRQTSHEDGVKLATGRALIKRK